MSEPSLDAARKRRATWIARAHFAGLVAVALAVGTVIPQLIVDDQDESEDAPVGSVERQRVVAWTLHQEGGETYVAVLASGGRPPVVLAVPATVTINIPGQNLGTLAEAAASGDGELVEVAIENLLGAPVDQSVLAPLSSLADTVDRLDGLEVRARTFTGSDAVTYLSEIPEGAPLDLAFLRWQDVLDGVVRADRADDLPQPLRGAMGGSDTDLVPLPVVDIGGGLLRPDQDKVDELLSRYFVPTTADVVRLVVLNGVGTPGIGKQVAGILVPEGFRLVSSGNANTFDLEVTQIVASSRGDLKAAERAMTLLGVGEISVGNQPAGLADVTVVVGRDFEAS